MNKYVLDTSALVDGMTGSLKAFKNFVRLCEKVKKGKALLCSSPLLLFELNNALRYLYDPLSAKMLYDHSLTYKIKIVNLRKEELDIARELAYETNTTFYDASYHALALSRDMVFLTMDKEYYKKAKEKGNVELFTKMKL